MYDIVIIGGGASGLMAAISSKYYNKNISVAIIEKNDRVAKKILTTGNGRCNLTNTDISIERYHGNNVMFAKSALSKFDKDATLDCFMQMGIYPKTEENKIYPYSLQASSVVDVLRLTIKKLGVSEICNFNCIGIKKTDNSFMIKSSDGKTITSKRIIVCSGGKAAPKLGTDGNSYKLLTSLGHKLLPIYPSLVQVKCNPEKVKAMKGVKLDANISVYVNGKFVNKEFGELLFTEYGLSGPVVFQLSRIASVETSKNNNVIFSVDIMPDASREEIYYHLCSRSKDVPVEDFLTGMINKLCARQLLKCCGIEKFNTTADVVDDRLIKKLTDTIKCWNFEVTGTKSWDSAQVTAGGIDTKEFNPSTLESNIIKGIYAAGELLDVDGDCGGFNLQWAWSSGFVAGLECAKSI